MGGKVEDLLKHIVAYLILQQIFMTRHSPKAQGAYNEVKNCEENVQIYNIGLMKKINQLGNRYILSAFLKTFTETDCLM